MGCCLSKEETNSERSPLLKSDATTDSNYKHDQTETNKKPEKTRVT
jgi:hypothetical protein